LRQYELGARASVDSTTGARSQRKRPSDGGLCCPRFSQCLSSSYQGLPSAYRSRVATFDFSAWDNPNVATCAGMVPVRRPVGRTLLPGSRPKTIKGKDKLCLHWESFGLAALEAQACGTPVVAPAVGDCRVVQDGESGFLVDSRAPEAFAVAVEKLSDRRLEPCPPREPLAGPPPSRGRPRPFAALPLRMPVSERRPEACTC
jgi:Glycosyl transferases group 1